MKKRKRMLEEVNNEKLHVKLNIIIRLLIELNKRISEEKFTNQMAITMLHSLGLTPREVADILGYKSRTSVASCLYSKKKRKSKVREYGKR